MISQQVNNDPTRNGLQSSPATSNAIRGAEQSGNIAKERFSRTRWVRGLTWQYGRHDKACGRYRSIGIAIERATSNAIRGAEQSGKERASSKANIEVISRV